MVKLSIILPSYNHASFLKERLDSIQIQSFKDWELIIIDDCSSDKSVEILEDFANENNDKIKHFIKNDSNSGSGYNSWKKGIELVETEYIWIAETDDFSDIHFLKEQVEALENNKQAVLSFCSSIYVNEVGNELYDSTRRTKDLNVLENKYHVFEGKVFIDRMPFNTYITNGSSVVFRKPTIEIPNEIFIHRQCSDIFLWTFLLQNSSFIFLNKKLNYFRRHNDSTTTKITLSIHYVGTYKELICYLSFFDRKDKYTEFIEHYFNYYVWNNKSEIFNCKVFEENKQLRNRYLTKLICLVSRKLISKKWKMMV